MRRSVKARLKYIDPLVGGWSRKGGGAE